MKKILVVLFACCMIAGGLLAQNRVPVDFDERVELMGLVFHLAGAQEYNYRVGETSEYMRSADEYFDSYRQHPAVAMASKLRETTIGYDAVATFGQNIIINQDGTLAFDTTIQKGSDTSFDRWTPQQKADFLPLLESFYQQSHFADWYATTESFRKECKKAFQDVESLLDVEWFSTFFGPLEDARFEITLSIFAGQNNYGCSAKTVEGTTLLRPVISSMIMNDGKPTYPVTMVLPIVVHEFCHAYCNPLNEQNWTKMSRSAEKTYKPLSDVLSRQAYTTAVTMMNETFVRASVIAYLSTHGIANVEPLIRTEEEMGFVLTGKYVDALSNYRARHSQYPTMESFMPQLVKVTNDFKYRQYLREKERLQKAMVQSKSNIKNGATDISSGEFEIRIIFAEPMNTNKVGVGISKNGFAFPKLLGYSWSDDAKTLILKVYLEPNHSYGYSVLGNEFLSQSGKPVAYNAWDFSTK